MPLPIIVRHLAGSALRGVEQSFARDSVRIGCDSTCDIVLDPSHAAHVSKSHARLHRDGEQILITDLGSEAGTYVNGRRIDAPTPLTSVDIVWLGSGGPKLAVSSGVARAAAPSTELRPTEQGALEPQAQIRHSAHVQPTPQAPAISASRPSPAPTRDQSGTSPRIVIHPDRASLPATPSAASPNPSRGPENFGAHRTHSHPTPTGAPEPAPRGTVARWIDSAVARERRRSTAALVLVGAALLAIVAVSWWSRGEVADWPRAYAQVRQSVYMVLRRQSRNGLTVETPAGTAWSYGPGQLATNAHVAQVFQQLQPGDELIARSAEFDGPDLRIEGVALHPDWVEFVQLCRLYSPIRFGSTPIQPQGQFDVALLRVMAQDVELQGPVLKRVNASELESVTNGAAIAFLGFPSEGRQVDAQKPAANSHEGTIAKSVDLLFANTVSNDPTNVWAFNLDVAGGESGSPVFRSDGRVIGLIAAMDALAIGPGVRLHQGISYGPRVDLLDEVGAASSARSAALEARLRALFIEGVRSPEPLARSLFEFALHERGVAGTNIRLLESNPLVLDTTGRALGERALTPGRLQGAVIVCTENPARIGAAAGVTTKADKPSPSDWRAIAHPQLPLHYAWTSAAVSGDEARRFTVLAQVESDALFRFPGSKATVFWFEAAP